MRAGGRVNMAQEARFSSPRASDPWSDLPEGFESLHI